MPNIFPPDPAVQITFNSSGGSFNDRVVEKIKSNAEKEKINFSSVENDEKSILFTGFNDYPLSRPLKGAHGGGRAVARLYFL